MGIRDPKGIIHQWEVEAGVGHASRSRTPLPRGCPLPAQPCQCPQVPVTTHPAGCPPSLWTCDHGSPVACNQTINAFILPITLHSAPPTC